MEPQHFYRRVYNGADIRSTHVISAVRFSKFKEGEKFRTHSVDSLEDYESGCRIHAQCFGHMCETPGGIMLPPQSMSMRTMEIATEYHAASKLAFAGNESEYIEKLKETNYTKHGTYRIIMSTPVAGSGRLIATPQWEFGRSVVAVSENLASRMKVCRKVYTAGGSVAGKYVETNLKEWDWVIVVRPPSLHFGNTQPMRIRFWKKDCIGIHPETFSMFHGDFDGDEAHIYPVFDVDSIAECEAWDVLPLATFQIGRAKLKSVRKDMGLPESIMYADDDSNAKFIEYTTMSAKQIADHSVKLVLGEQSRNKEKHIKGMSDRFVSESTADSFVQESIRGMEDVKRQQLSQGTLGDMTRVSKIVASCFYRPYTGSLYVKRRHESATIVNDLIKDIGTPSVRGMAGICAVAQQAALDSHRAESRDPVSHDFISDLILGCYRKVHASHTREYTFVELFADPSRRTEAMKLVSQCSPRWVDDQRSDTIHMLCKPKSIKLNMARYIKSAYSPEILSVIQKQGLSVRAVCENGIKVVCNYYGVRISALELHDVSVVFSYRPEASVHPITTREGMMSRELGWIETFEATDYTKLPSLEGNFETPDTSTAAMFMSNFSNLKAKYE
ncbi:hypothetical protein NW766_012860 [Fusarium irregulare]|uniref:RNA polymerase alpha subunit domain-containing protein n=1 Tax=Fusarium irregulare TaxID=2494466 RepID=A0A9W8PCX5_9HYPO|nr:hypothetical protein NW766_012860 [Fusarium irregulare]